MCGEIVAPCERMLGARADEASLCGVRVDADVERRLIEPVYVECGRMRA